MNIVIVDCFDTWEHRVDLLYKVLTSEGHKVRVMMSDFRHIEKVYRNDRKKDYIFFHAEPYEKNISIARLRSHVRLGKRIFSFIERHSSNIDLLWVLAPPNVFISDVAKFKQKNPGVRLIIDLIDLWPETMPVGKIKPLLWPWKMLRNKYLRYAETVVTECNLYQEVLGSVLNGIDVHTLYLAREDNGYIPKLNLPDDKISLCYLGSINNIIDIDAIGSVIRECERIKPVILHIIGDGEKKDELVRVTEIAGASVVDHGKVYDRQLKQEIFDSCHYGLNIMKKTVCIGLTMKSVDYFEFGLPIINNIHGDTWDVIERCGCGTNVVTTSDGVKFEDEGLFLSSNEHAAQRNNSRGFFVNYLSVDEFRNRVIKILTI